MIFSRKIICQLETVLVFLMLLVSACSQLPTRPVPETQVKETKTPQINFSKSNLSKEHLNDLRSSILSNSVILDTRPATEFYVNKVPGSILVDWKDFNLKLEGAEGVLDSDPLNITKRLALWGIDQETKVIVIGKDIGVMGRVAWMISEMGVKNVKTFSYDVFRKEVPGLNESQPQNKTMWMPLEEIRTELKFDEFQRMVFPFNYHFSFYTIKDKDEKSGLRVGRIKNAKIVYLDVRSEDEFKNQSLKTMDAKFPLVHLPYENFYTVDGLVNPNVTELLKSNGIEHDNIIVSISNQGVRSGAVTFALKELGYLEAKNFSGGYNYFKKSMELEKQVNAIYFEKEKTKKKTSKRKKNKKNKKMK